MQLALRGDGSQAQLLYLLRRLQSGQVAKPQLKRSRHRQHDRGGDESDGQGGAESGMAAYPFSRSFAPRRVGRVHERAVRQVTLEVFDNLPGRLIAPGWVGLETVLDDRFGTGRDRLIPLPHRGRPASLGDHDVQQVLDRIVPRSTKYLPVKSS